MNEADIAHSKVFCDTKREFVQKYCMYAGKSGLCKTIEIVTINREEEMQNGY